MGFETPACTAVRYSIFLNSSVVAPASRAYCAWRFIDAMSANAAKAATTAISRECDLTVSGVLLAQVLRDELLDDAGEQWALGAKPRKHRLRTLRCRRGLLPRASEVVPECH